MKKEIWRDIPGYEGLYEVSSYGNIRSTRRKGTSGGIKKATVNQDGYLRVKLCKDGREKKLMVHRLVYEAFFGPMPENTEINHIDENKKNNHIENIEAITHLQNIKHGTGVRRCAAAHHKPVAQYSTDGELIAIYGSRKEATQKTGVRGSGISLAIHGKNKTAGGFIWSRAQNERMADEKSIYESI